MIQMMDYRTVDFAKMGFKAGLEVHHQIRSNRKLFCNCKPVLITSSTQPDYTFERNFRPVLGEMGDFDEGMLIEYEKGYRVIYHAFNHVNCLYEQDEQPPFEIDMQAVYAGYELAHWLNFNAMVDEVIVARKQYLDGSITTGFQRTMIIARDGYIVVDGKKIRISNLTVEEDSARKIKTENNGRTVYYNLDRLGVPLVEVITDHRDCNDPKTLQKAAETIGLVLRLSGIGKRGIGTVRQDVNISITGGDRVEIKGVQDLSLFEEMAKREMIRQDMLIKIAAELQQRNFNPEELQHTYFDFSEYFEARSSVVMGIRIPKFAHLLALEIQPERDLGQDFFEKASLISGIPVSNLYHAEERGTCQRKLHNVSCYFFNVVTDEFDEIIRKELGVTEEDTYVLGIGPQKQVIHAMKKIIERVKMAIKGVPQETRKVLPNGNSEFLRVIHGKQRLYPDTDSLPISIDSAHVEKLKKKVRVLPWELEKQYPTLTFSQLSNLIRHNSLQTFQQLTSSNIAVEKAYQFLEGTMRELQKNGGDPSLVKFENILDLLRAEQAGNIDMSMMNSLLFVMITAEKSLAEVLAERHILAKPERDEYLQSREFQNLLQEVRDELSSSPNWQNMPQAKHWVVMRLLKKLADRNIHIAGGALADKVEV